MTRHAAFLLALAGALAGPSSRASAEDIVLGVWNGIATRIVADGRILNWTVSVNLTSLERGTIDYRSINCGGTLTFLRATGEVREYREQLTYGQERCIDNGTVGFWPKLGQLIWYWSGEGTAEPTSIDIGILKRD